MTRKLISNLGSTLCIGLVLALTGCGDNEVTTPPAPAVPGAPGAPGAPATPVVAPPAAPAAPKPPPASGANVLNVNGVPNFGERAVSIGFAPDPLVVPVVSGGNLDVSTAQIQGASCRGWATARPDVNIRVNNMLPFLRIFMNANAGADTTLIVNKPDGSWVCADDVFGMNPSVDIPIAMPGMYNVWVGSYRTGEQAQGTLNVTASNTLTPSGQATPLNPAGNPNFGMRSLAPGFPPTTVDVTSGGSIHAQESSAGGNCRGYVTAQPDVNVTLTGPASQLSFFIDNAANNADTTMIVQLPNGTFQCDDDTNGTSPQVDVTVGAPGAYHVWIGSYRSGEQAHARLNITQGGGAGGGK